MAEIVVGSFTPSVLLDVAERTGRLRARGLAVTEVAVTSSPDQFRSLRDGAIAVALTSPDNVIAYRFDERNPMGGLMDARIVAPIDRGMGLGLYARPGGTATDLAHGQVGVDVPTSGFALALYALAESMGVRRDELDPVALGSTPRRLEALLAGDCAATMLNAGNELVAEDAGCVCLASVGERLPPYLGTVVAVVGDAHLAAAADLAGALVDTAAEIVAGGLDAEVTGSASDRLCLDDRLARRYLARMRAPHEGLVPDGNVDRESLQTLVRLRTTYLPSGVTPEPVEQALDVRSGLVHGA